jgi:type II secretory ATPase GspE/PulE/Tfp pilus assembly ATPase PilB-like protein
VTLDLDKLGFADAHVGDLREQAAAPTGLILVTGPTGSGKTTTLYGVLGFLNTDDRNLITVEDPVEYELSGITQVQVDRKAERTFASTLRSMMRQDPDVVMVGEIRDYETAEIAVHAALTGHMVLSTLHTNSAIGTVTRLIDMGVAPYLMAPSLRAIVAQRLVRRVCGACAEEYPAPAKLLEALGLAASRERVTFKRAVGCKLCRGRGYTGRLPLLEVLVWSPELAQLLVRGASELELLETARRAGFRPMIVDGAEKACHGITTPEEVLDAVRA